MGQRRVSETRQHKCPYRVEKPRSHFGTNIFYVTSYCTQWRVFINVHALSRLSSWTIWVIFIGPCSTFVHRLTRSVILHWIFCALKHTPTTYAVFPVNIPSVCCSTLPNVSNRYFAQHLNTTALNYNIIIWTAGSFDVFQTGSDKSTVSFKELTIYSHCFLLRCNKHNLVI